MNYLWGAVNAISAPYQYYKDINPATLTGAIDVIVVRRPGFDGTMELVCSPFHVRFGKLQVLRPSEKKVDITVNGKSVPFSMKIGEAGEAFFVFETDSDVPDDLITSPLLEPTQPVSLHPLPQEDFGRFGTRNRRGDLVEDGLGQEPDFLDLDAPSTLLSGEISKTIPNLRNTTMAVFVEAVKEVSQNVQDYSVDSCQIEPSAISPGDGSREKPPEAVKPNDDAASRHVLNGPSALYSTDIGDDDFNTAMGPLKAQRMCLLQDHTDDSPQSQLKDRRSAVSTSNRSLDLTDVCHHPASPSNKPIPFPSLHPPTALSPDHHTSVSLPQSSATSDEYSWEWGEFPQRSQIRMEYTVSDTAPVKIVHGTETDEQLVVSQLGEFQRSKSLPPEFELDVTEGITSTSLQSNEQELHSDVETGFDHDSGTLGRESKSWVRWWRRDNRHPRGVDIRSEHPPLQSVASAPLPGETEDDSSAHVPSPDERARDAFFHTLPPSSSELRANVPSSFPRRRPKIQYAKTLRLTSEQLEALDLRPGANTITFSLSSSGVTACAARIFMWEYTDSVMVSDIDGTITKSDALGHVFNLIGRDWTHLGVAKLYTDIYKNGYKIMYLTSRAIGQADSTRYYLQGIKQNDYQLPEGPVIMSPDRLMASLHREVIMRKPEVFKMACLRDIQRLFGPAAPLPFYAGFGNRITDALSYRSVNIPSSRIFTIDSNGEVKMELLDLVGHKSESVQSYIHMTDLVDLMFPPIAHRWESGFTDNNYWKAPLAEFHLPDLAPPSPALSARSDASNQSAFARLRNFSLRSTNSGRTRPYPPSPHIEARRGRDMDATGLHNHQRQLSSIERLSNALAGLASRSVSPSTPSAQESGSEEDCDSRDASDYTGRPRRLRKHSTRSMPGSLPGSRPSSDVEDLEFGVPHKDTDDSLSDPEAETAEQEFDEDIFAAGEMQKVPFL